jgi:hypothetical protein
MVSRFTCTHLASLLSAAASSHLRDKGFLYRMILVRSGLETSSEYEGNEVSSQLHLVARDGVQIQKGLITRNIGMSSLPFSSECKCRARKLSRLSLQQRRRIAIFGDPTIFNLQHKHTLFILLTSIIS